MEWGRAGRNSQEVCASRFGNGFRLKRDRLGKRNERRRRNEPVGTVDSTVYAWALCNAAFAIDGCFEALRRAEAKVIGGMAGGDCNGGFSEQSHRPSGASGKPARSAIR